MDNSFPDSPTRAPIAIQVFGVSLLLVATATAVNVAQEPLSTEVSPFLFLSGAVLAATWWGGMRCGVTTTTLAALSADFFFIGTRYRFVVPTVSSVIPLILFIGEGVFISWVVARLRRANDDRGRLLNDEQAARTQLAAHAARLREIAGSLRESEARFSSIFKQATTGIIQMDLSGRFLMVNKRYSEIVGRSEPELLEMSMQDITHPDDLQRSLELWERLRDRGEEFVIEKRYVRPDGVVVWVDKSVSLVRDDQNDQYIIAVVQDITNRKRNEEELTVYRERLEELVIGRTEALRKSTELVRRSERLASIGTLAAGIAHEVNNPLNAILLTAECMLRINRANDDPELKNALRTISQEAQRGGRIVQSVLQFAREEKSARSSCDLNAIAQNAVELTRSYVRIPAALSVTFELTNPLSAVLANATELEQVVVNLVKNAAEAAEGDVHVLIQTREAVNSGVELVVKDDGPGIPEDEQSRIFDPFFSRRRNSGGVGLGLSLCHRIIDDHGGAISVAGKPGEGTKFTIWLPKGDSTPVDSGDGI